MLGRLRLPAMEVHHLKQETDFAALVHELVKFGHEALIIFMQVFGYAILDLVVLFCLGVWLLLVYFVLFF